MKKIAGSAALWTFAHATDSVPPGHQIDEFAIELLASVPTSLQVPPSFGRLSFRIILDVQITTQMNFDVAATLERFDSAK